MIKNLLILTGIIAIGFLSSCSDSKSQGCTDPLALNYEPTADYDDGSCLYGGCTDPIASNYDPTATLDDGSCLYGGCTDPIASNYDPTATLDDGTCFYNAEIVFWYDAITANELNLYNDIIYGPIDRLDFYVEGVYVGSESPAFIYDGIPICNEPTYVSTTMEWTNNRNTLVNYSVIGVHEALLADLETVVDQYAYDLTANECAPFQVRFLTKK